MKKLKDFLPFWEVKNIRLLYTLNFLRNSKFYDGIWIFFWLRFMDFGQLGIMQTIAFGFGLLAEIPAGAMCDLIGRKKTAIMSSFFPTIGAFVIAFASSANWVLAGFMLVHLGWSMYQGSVEGLAYEALVETGKKHKYDKVSSANTIVSILSSNINIALGGLLYLIDYRLPYIAWGIFYFLTFVFSFGYEETFEREKFNFGAYFKQLYQGFLQLITPQMKAFFVVILVLRGLIYTYGMGMLRPSIALGFGFTDKMQSFLFSAIGFVILPLVYLMPKLRTKISDKKGLYILTIILGIAFLLSSLPLGYFGVIPMIMFSICGSLTFPWVSVVVNHEVPSKYRATTMATTNLLMKLPYVLSAMFIGRIIQNGKLPSFTFGLGIVIILSVFVSAYIYKKLERKYRFNLKYRIGKIINRI